ncbi:DUF2164 domain-containing protein [Paenibacillus massiliensis]|uniref:DUF2164 domain-containing protein n=1 Tax=Paenibacillus massiliensis TaxID=225917 RepID=UPI00040FC0E7|nr:DUF2164 domain-containing protein [Paenibacillus massiliensis]
MIPLQLPREEKLQLIASLQHYFEMERSEEIGELAAENLLDYILKELSPYVYNRAIHDARKVIDQQMLNLEEELYALQKPVR